MKIRIPLFAGMRPIRSADSLAPGEAQDAVNTKLSSGALEPFKGLTASPIVTFSGGTVESIYRFSQLNTNEAQFWFQHTADMNVVKGPIDNDTEERTYLTGRAGYPEKTKSDIATTSTPYPTTLYRMGVPAPTIMSAPGVSGVATTPADPGETFTYVTTYVTNWGEEGPPSVASAYAPLWKAGQTADLTGLPTGPGAGYTIASKNLYRSARGSSSTKFQFVANLTLAATTYSDTTITAELGDVLATDGWVEPPDDMIGLTSMANGVMAGFTGNTLCLSEPYAPYAWPVRYQRSTDAPIVGLGAFDQSLFVGTTTGVYVLTGTDPANMTFDKLAVAQSCVSKRSIVEMMGGVIFASPDGLMFIGPSGVRNMTESLMTRTQWQAYQPSSMAGYESDNNYLAFYDTGSATGGLVFSFGESPTFCRTDVYASAGYRDKSRDALYLVVSGNALKKWDDPTGSALTATWRSGVFRLPGDTNMAAASVDASAYPLTFKLYSDDVLMHTETVANKFGFRLPDGYRSSRLFVEIVTTGIVRDVRIAESMRELARG